MNKNAASSVQAKAARRPQHSRWLNRILPVALVLGLLSGGLGAALDALPAGAVTAVSAVSFSATSYEAFETDVDWVAQFETSSTGIPLSTGSVIYVTFAAGFVIPSNPTVTVSGAGPSCTATATTGGSQTVTVVLGASCSVADSTFAQVDVFGITNPTAGTYDNTLFWVSTTSDTTAVSPGANVVITPAVTTVSTSSLTGVTFTGSSMSAGATGTTWTIGFTTSATGELLPGDQIEVDFPAGFVIPANPTVTLGAGFFDCTSSPQATAVTSGTTVLITLGPGCEIGDSTAGSVSISGITNPAAGTYVNTSFFVSTSEDYGASPATNVVITGSTTVVTSTCPLYSGNAAFVCLVYEDLLGRVPDAGGLAAWEGLLAAGVSRQQVAYDIATSPEHFTDLVQGDYEYFLGRAADAGGLSTWVGALEAGWTPQAVLAGILSSPEYYADAGSTPTGFVTDLYSDLLGRTPDAGGLATWVGQLNIGMSRGAVAAGIIHSTEYEADFVQDVYFFLLNRGADPQGLATWVYALAVGVSEEWVIAGILGSPEFYVLSQEM
jgi:hypothetical protein